MKENYCISPNYEVGVYYQLPCIDSYMSGEEWKVFSIVFNRIMTITQHDKIKNKYVEITHDWLSEKIGKKSSKTSNRIVKKLGKLGVINVDTLKYRPNHYRLNWDVINSLAKQQTEGLDKNVPLTEGKNVPLTEDKNVPQIININNKEVNKDTDGISPIGIDDDISNEVSDSPTDTSNFISPSEKEQSDYYSPTSPDEITPSTDEDQTSTSENIQDTWQYRDVEDKSVVNSMIAFTNMWKEDNVFPSSNALKEVCNGLYNEWKTQSETKNKEIIIQMTAYVYIAYGIDLSKSWPRPTEKEIKDLSFSSIWTSWHSLMTIAEACKYNTTAITALEKSTDYIITFRNKHPRLTKILDEAAANATDLLNRDKGMPNKKRSMLQDKVLELKDNLKAVGYEAV